MSSFNSSRALSTSAPSVQEGKALSAGHALSARLRAQRDYEGPKPNFAPINKRVNLGKGEN